MANIGPLPILDLPRTRDLDLAIDRLLAANNIALFFVRKRSSLPDLLSTKFDEIKRLGKKDELKSKLVMILASGCNRRREVIEAKPRTAFVGKLERQDDRPPLVQAGDGQ